MTMASKRKNMTMMAFRTGFTAGGSNDLSSDFASTYFVGVQNVSKLNF